MSNTNLLWSLLSQTLGTNFEYNRDLRRDVRNLSELFTENRKTLPSDYWQDPRWQRAYLAYFVPLNFMKIYTLLKAHKVKIPHGKWCDLGCGPGTATLAALLWYSESSLSKPLEIYLIDSSESALTLAKNLIGKFAEELEISVKIFTSASLPPEDELKFDLSLSTNVLNELKSIDDLMPLWQRTKGIFFALEPSHRVASQKLVRFRERVVINATNIRIIGPCLHQSACPVYRTKHWCHFSEPLTDEHMVSLNTAMFKDPRLWLKFSYFITEHGTPRVWDERTFRAIGDLHQQGPFQLAIDLCQPNSKKIFSIPKQTPFVIKRPLVRGAAVSLLNRGRFRALPLTKRQKPSISKV